jgi:IclR family pca regulon transcriptional regulator
MMIMKNSTKPNDSSNGSSNGSSNDSSYTVPALSRGLLIIEMFRNTKRVLSTQDFSEALQVSPSSIYRIVQTLIDMKYLSKVARNTYELGPQVISNGFSYLASRDLVDVAAPHLQQLRDSTSVSCHLAILDGWETIYIYRALASQRLSVNVPIGTRLPNHTNALGRALLSKKTPEELSQLYIGKQLDNHPRPQPQNLLELAELIQIERSQGYAISYSDNATAIAAPLFNYAGEIVAAINASGPDVIMKDKVVNRGIMEQLLKTAAKISMELGYRV